LIKVQDGTLNSDTAANKARNACSDDTIGEKGGLRTERLSRSIDSNTRGGRRPRNVALATQDSDTGVLGERLWRRVGFSDLGCEVKRREIAESGC